jgi:YhcH/YjgK/YiaL family protein
MIVSDLEHVSQQAAQTLLLHKAFDFLKAVANTDLQDGRIPIEGDRVYALVQSYRKAPPSANGGPLLETHRQYIDIQYVASGVEAIGWAPVARLTVIQPYDSSKDAEFGVAPPAALTLVRLTAGQLAVLWPEDAHAPRLAADQPAQVKKIVVKVAL